MKTLEEYRCLLRRVESFVVPTDIPKSEWDGWSITQSFGNGVCIGQYPEGAGQLLSEEFYTLARFYLRHVAHLSWEFHFLPGQNNHDNREFCFQIGDLRE